MTCNYNSSSLEKEKKKIIWNGVVFNKALNKARRHYCFLLHVGIVRDYWAVCNRIVPHSEKKKKSETKLTEPTTVLFDMAHEGLLVPVFH